MRFATGWNSDLFISDPTFDRFGLAQLSCYSARYVDLGHGPPIVVVPGMAGGIGLVMPLIRELARKHRVLAFDLRGEADCFSLRRRYTIHDLGSDLHEFLDWHGLERPHVVGVSFGGVVALDYAARFPHRLASLSVQGVGARLDSNLMKLIAGIVLTGYPLPADNPFINQFFRLLLGRGPFSPSLLEFVARTCWQTDQSVMSQRFRLIKRRDIRKHVARIDTPTLVMSAAKDLLISDSSLLDLCNLIDEVRFSRLSRGGHMPFVVSPDEMASEIEQFVAEYE